MAPCQIPLLHPVKGTYVKSVPQNYDHEQLTDIGKKNNATMISFSINTTMTRVAKQLLPNPALSNLQWSISIRTVQQI